MAEKPALKKKSLVSHSERSEESLNVVPVTQVKNSLIVDSRHSTIAHGLSGIEDFRGNDKKVETKKAEPHNSLLEKPDDVMPTIRTYNPKIDAEIKKDLTSDDDQKPTGDVNWWGKQ